MSGRGGRWLMVTFWLPDRSKAQRRAATRFANQLVEDGYQRVHPGQYLRYLPGRRRVVPETARLKGQFPAVGTLHVIEVTPASLARSSVTCDGEPVKPPSVPELLSVY